MKNKYATLIPVAVCVGALGRDLLPKAMKWLMEKKKANYCFCKNHFCDEDIVFDETSPKLQSIKDCSEITEINKE